MTPDQEEQLKKAEQLDIQVTALFQKRKFREALPLAQEALQIKKSILGESHPDYATSLSNLAGLHYGMGADSEAEPLFLQALNIRKEVLGDRHPRYADSLNNLAALYDHKRDYSKAEPLYLQLLDIRKRVRGEEDPDYLQSLNNLAGLYVKMRAYSKAETLYLQELNLSKKALRPEDPLYAKIANDLGSFYFQIGAYSKAEPLFLQAREIYKKVVGEEHLSYSVSLYNLAKLYEAMGEYAKAEPLYLQAREIKRKVGGEENPDYAQSLRGLASLYSSMGEYAKAEPLLLQARDIQKKVHGEEHPEYAGDLNDLAILYRDLGDYAKAESLLQQVLEIYKKIHGEEHPFYAAGLGNLAGVYLLTEEYEKALPLFIQCLDIMKKVYGGENPKYAACLNNLAILYSRLGDYKKAEPLLQQATEIDRKVFGDNHPDYARNLENLALLYKSMGEYAKAEPLYRQGREIKRNVLGEEHPSYAVSLHNLSVLYWSMNDYAKAESFAQEALTKEVALFELITHGLSEARARIFLSKNHIECSFLLHLLKSRPDADPAKAYAVVWMTRGLQLEQSTEHWQTAQRDPSVEPLLSELRKTQAKLAQLVLSMPKPDQIRVRRQALTELNEHKEELEAKLYKASDAFRREQDVRKAVPGDLLKRMAADSALVEIVQRFENNSEPGRNLGGQWVYEGFVLRSTPSEPGYRVAWVHLGEAKTIDQYLTAWRDSIASQKLPESTSPEAMLRKLVWDPLEEHLQGCKTVYIVPDGKLHFLPWAALPGRNPGTVLLEDYALATTSSGKQLYNLLTDPFSPGNGLLLVGDVAYNDSPDATPSSSAMLASKEEFPSRAPAIKERVVWGELKGTKTEIEGIGTTWQSSPSPEVLQGSTASEMVLRSQLPGHRYIHLATHGFFADESFRSLFGHTASTEQLFPGSQGERPRASRQATAAERNPLILSGLVLAGANLPPKMDALGSPTGEDGILTAEEIVAMDLRGTELVVLSACETGLGEVAGGEGVYGLTRAFQVAGARNVIASLWKVDDQATATLMRLFYYKLGKERKPPIEALREAQLTLYRHPEQIPLLAAARGPDFAKLVPLPDQGKRMPRTNTAAIHQWAAFILSGTGY